MASSHSADDRSGLSGMGDGVNDKPEPMIMWVVYIDPDDAPGEVMARKWAIVSGQKEPVRQRETIRVETKFTGPAVSQMTTDQLKAIQINEVRRLIQDMMPGAMCFPRNPNDETTILETWM